MAFALIRVSYPENLLSDIMMTDDVKKYMNADNIRGLHHVLYSLSRLTRSIINERYINHLTFEKIACKYQIELHKVRNILEKAIRDIRMTEKINFITLGFEGYKKEYKKMAQLKKESVSLDCLGLSNRTYNALRRAGYNNINEISNFSMHDFLLINNIGENYASEIISAIKNYKKDAILAV